ncbi:MAG: hypothetical protein H7256_16490 [Bdellovibrio sp.]|nr:hypothetical protein [Bdellovibrio sp.]
MKLKLAITILLAAINASACTTATRHVAGNHEQAVLSLPSEGGRVSVHGMVIFGSGPYFIEHIPMLHAPHDFQIVASVEILDKTGKLLTPDFSNQGFTFEPSANFSLDDFMAGKITHIEGSIHEGSFEQGGKIIPGFESIVIAVTKMNLVRQLPSEGAQTFFEVSDLKYTYQTNIITPKNSVQNLENKTLHKNLWCVVGPDFYDPCPQ